jgi:hypothetical protein
LAGAADCRPPREAEAEMCKASYAEAFESAVIFIIYLAL